MQQGYNKGVAPIHVRTRIGGASKQYLDQGISRMEVGMRSDGG